MKFLFLEDDEAAVEFMVRILRRDGFEFDYIHVDNEREFIKQMPSADLLIVDCSIFSFSCEDALLAWHSTGEQQPFIIVSGTISNTKGIILQDIGATAFVLKSTPKLLCNVVRKALGNKTHPSGD